MNVSSGASGRFSGLLPEVRETRGVKLYMTPLIGDQNNTLRFLDQIFFNIVGNIWDNVQNKTKIII